MSLFGSMLRDFGDDPFFSLHNDQMQRADRLMMDNFASPFGGMFGGFGFPQLMGAPAPVAAAEVGQVQQQHQRRGPGNGNRHQAAMMPFGFGRSVFPDIGGMFSGLERMTNDPNSNCHMYSSSSVVSYSMGQDGQPKVYQASSSTTTAPGGVKETRRAMSDSTTGVRKMAIGHHLGERAHIVEKSQNKITGEEDDAEEFINIGDGEEGTFNEEWSQRTVARSTNSRATSNRLTAPPRSGGQQLAIAAGPSHETPRHGLKRDRNGNSRNGDRKPQQQQQQQQQQQGQPTSRKANGDRQQHGAPKSKPETSM